MKENDFFNRTQKDNDAPEVGNEEYNEFVEKFKPKKTTDDCYTPDRIYNAVAEWVEREYGVKRENFVRPFYPGGDYERYEYGENAVVVDNPPFSILSKILTFYNKRKVKFFLFAPTLTLLSSSSSSFCCCALACAVHVTYENGASVNTSFLTNLEDTVIRSAPSLYSALKKANDENLREKTKELPKYAYPLNLITAPAVAQFSKYGVDFSVARGEAYHARGLDAQKAQKKAIYGAGYLISDNAAAEREKAEREKAEREKAEREKAEREKAERAKAIVWQLSEREKEIIKKLNEK